MILWKPLISPEEKISNNKEDDISTTTINFFEHLWNISDESLVKLPLVKMIFPTNEFIRFARHYNVERDLK